MAMNNESGRLITKTVGKELYMERWFDAPKALVYTAYTDEEHVKKWWGPEGWTTTIYKMDVRPEGIWQYCMRASDGQESWGKAVFKEVLKNEKLVYTDAFSDAEGHVADGMPVMDISITFLDDGQGTRVASATRFGTQKELKEIVEMGAIEGMAETWRRLETYLKEISPA